MTTKYKCLNCDTTYSYCPVMCNECGIMVSVNTFKAEKVEDKTEEVNDDFNKTIVDIVSAMTREKDGDREMISSPGPRNSQDYTKENCEKFGIPFLPDFVDIDTRITDEGHLRIQGYIEIYLLKFKDYTIDQLQYVHKLFTESNSRLCQCKGDEILEVWNCTEKLK